jgi:uncharacterized protein (DUF488 family)
MVSSVVTIGVYGFNAEQFFGSLVDADIDLFCDLRARRGVRGSEYTFANAQRLQAKLAELQIEYVHYPALAPTKEIRSNQYAADAASGTAKRQREQLGPAFLSAYFELLRGPGAQAAIADIRHRANRPCLFCVERLPSACHRSLVAEALAEGGVPVLNLLP